MHVRGNVVKVVGMVKDTRLFFCNPLLLVLIEEKLALFCTLYIVIPLFYYPRRESLIAKWWFFGCFLKTIII